jgi:hypothetical protein
MNTQAIKLDQLRAHPANSNVMPEHFLTKLANHIERTGQYPPLIVRPVIGNDNYDPPKTDCQSYQILDGHHRVAVLRRLEHDTAECVIWEVEDREALLLLASLNRLQGQDDPRKRARLIGTLTEQHNLTALADLLPERRDQLKKLLEINGRPPSPRPPQPIEQMPVAVHFFLLPHQKSQLVKILHSLGGSREEALMKLLNKHAESDVPTN